MAITHGISGQARAQWRSGGVPICTADHNQEAPFVIADGSGGAFVGWADWRDSLTSESDAYLQHLNSDGVPMWGDCGIPVCTEPGIQSQPHLILDGQGGVIAAWVDVRSGLFSDIYAQRIDFMGNSLWTPGGIRLSISTDDKYLNFSTRSTIASDGAGGAIIAWDERLNGFDLNIWAQRIDASGSLRWSSRGRRVSGAVGFQMFATLVSDDRGGAIIAWEDWRETPNPQVFAQRVSSTGAPYWELHGIRVTPASGKGIGPVMVFDGSGGAIVGWTGSFPGGSSDIYAQRLGDTGPHWQAGGVVVSAAPGIQQDPRMATTETGGAILTWIDRRSDPGCISGCEWDAYAQQVDSAGTPSWEQDGVPLSTLVSYQGPGVAASDGAGGAIFAWPDTRPGADGQYIQHLDASGTPQWAAHGVPINSDKGSSSVMAGDGSGGAILVWSDNRNGIYDEFFEPMNLDIYAARITTAGNVDVPPAAPDFRLLPARPNPTRAETVIPFDLPSSRTVDLEIFSLLGQRVRTLARSQEYPLGKHELVWNGRTEDGNRAAPGIYLLRLSTGGRSVVGRIVLLR